MLSGQDHEHYGSAWSLNAKLRPGVWHHLAGVWNQERLDLYLDGVLSKTHPLPALRRPSRVPS